MPDGEGKGTGKDKGAPKGKDAGKGKGAAAPKGKGAGKGKPKGERGWFKRLLADLALLRHPKRFWKQKRRLALALIAAFVLGIAGIAVAYEALKRPADVHNPDAIFKPEKPQPPPKRDRTVNWPMFGLNPARTRYLPASGVQPPFRKLWRYTEKPLLEFPPIFVNGSLYFVNNSGFAYALDADTGKVLWERRIGRLNASLAGLLAPPPLHRQPRPRPPRQARRQDRQRDLETLAAGPGRVLAGGGRRHRLLRLRKRRTVRAQHPQRQHPLVDPARRCRSSRRPPTPTATSTSATTAAT